MARQKTDIPEECVSALRTGLSNFFDSGDAPAASLPLNCEVLPVYSLGLSAFPLEAAEKLPQLQPVGWRFIGTGPASGLGCHVSGEPARLIGAVRTQEIAYLLDCFRQVKELRGAPPELSGQDYELRALRIPGLLIEAFWVYCSDTRQPDYVVPFGGIYGDSLPGENGGDNVKWTLEPMKFYSAMVFFKEVGAAAKRKLQMHAGLYGPPKAGDHAQGNSAIEPRPPQPAPVSSINSSPVNGEVGAQIAKQ